MFKCPLCGKEKSSMFKLKFHMANKSHDDDKFLSIRVDIFMLFFQVSIVDSGTEIDAKASLLFEVLVSMTSIVATASARVAP